MTKGQIESKTSEAISKFEIEQMDEDQKRLGLLFFRLQDLIVIR